MNFVVIASLFGDILYCGVNPDIPNGSWFYINSDMEPIAFSSLEEASQLIPLKHPERFQVISLEEFQILRVMTN